MNRVIHWGIVILMMGASVVPGSALAQGSAAGVGAELVAQLAKELGSTTKHAEGQPGRYSD